MHALSSVEMVYYYETGAGFRIHRRDVELLRAQADADGDAAQVAICDEALTESEFGALTAMDAWRQVASVLLPRRAA